MKIIAISDLHGYYPDDIPACDLLLIAGDVSPVSNPSIQRKWFPATFKYWLYGLKNNGVKEIIGIAGNHDRVFQEYPEDERKWDLPWTYLEDSSTVVNDFKIYGSPWQPWFHDWAFNAERPLSSWNKNEEHFDQAKHLDPSEPELTDIFSKIPTDTDILITHTPPKNILDYSYDGERVGSNALSARIKHLDSLKLHVFGHIHPADESGRRIELDDVVYANVSIVNKEREHVFTYSEFEL